MTAAAALPELCWIAAVPLPHAWLRLCTRFVHPHTCPAVLYRCCCTAAAHLPACYCCTAKKAMNIAADMCIHTNKNFTIESLGGPPPAPPAAAEGTEPPPAAAVLADAGP